MRDIPYQTKTQNMVPRRFTIDVGSATYSDLEKAIKYLGITLNPWKGMCKRNVQEIINAAKCVKNLKLKLHQKINLIRIYLLPKYIHKLVAN